MPQRSIHRKNYFGKLVKIYSRIREIKVNISSINPSNGSRKPPKFKIAQFGTAIDPPKFNPIKRIGKPKTQNCKIWNITYQNLWIWLKSKQIYLTLSIQNILGGKRSNLMDWRVHRIGTNRTFKKLVNASRWMNCNSPVISIT